MSERKLTACGNSYHNLIRMNNQNWRCLKCGTVLHVVQNKGITADVNSFGMADVALIGSSKSIHNKSQIDTNNN